MFHSFRKKSDPTKQEIAQAQEKHQVLQKLSKQKKKYSELLKDSHKEIIKNHIKKERKPLQNLNFIQKKLPTTYIKTGIDSFDALFDKGIPKSNSILIAGAPGTGKTILTLQIANYSSIQGKKVFYMSFEESEDRLREHMEGFGWKPEELEKKGLLVIKRFDPFKLSRSIEGLLAKARGELLIDVGVEDLMPKKFKPDIIILDSISALAAGFVSGGETYRIYIEQLFKYFEKLGVTSFLISETEDAPKKLSDSGVEEFLADGVIVMYYIKGGNIRERAVEVLKMRGAKHSEKIVAMEITGKGIIIYPEQEIFAEVEG